MTRTPVSNVEPIDRRPTDPRGIGLDAATLTQVFPFHIALDAQFRVVQTGQSLTKIYPTVVPGTRFDAQFTIIDPKVTLTLDAIIEQPNARFLARSRAAPHGSAAPDLHGQMVAIETDDTRSLLFLCAPVLTNPADLIRFGLTPADFAPHDDAPNSLIILATAQAAVSEQAEQTKRLSHELQASKEAEMALEAANEELETRVELRARELEEVNSELQANNLRLKAWTKQLEERNHQILILNKMGDMLRACKAVDETYDVIRDCLGRLFPGLGGELALYSETDHHYEVVASWGEMPEAGRIFVFEDCWGLRLGHLHSHETDEDKTRCAHLGDARDGAYICVPMNAQEKRVGLLHLEWTPEKLNTKLGARAARDSHRHLADTAAEKIALSIANLILQQSLQRQSIRDPLTGLYNRRHLEEAVGVEVSRASRSRNAVSFILLNVDDLKQINDEYGHVAGDRILRELGKLLRQNLRSLDIPCRFDGDEFLLILPGTLAEDGYRRAESLRAIIESNLRIPIGEPRVGSTDEPDFKTVTISIGVSAFPLNGNEPETVLRAADAALVTAKKAGGNQVSMAPLRPTTRTFVAD